ncbi:lactate racemase domain-containing protein [Paenibacillus thalictri]|uniref:DUF2088 domain-containing protein n=1 Tax=Paenibacillus thalictri TaxID=2527873 RepID=A0A4Q9DMK1_9BACL|nr:lactate racemase domain-containing protein [Paenibacillus thalictri]TBL76517.1 DUF2088 domain-containing protein [Paenibacillus thalictri]
MIFPRMLPVEQLFERPRVADLPGALREQFDTERVRAAIKPGTRVAVAVGSRGIADLQLIVTCVVRMLRELGAEPFIVPAMGSHGGATAEGQTAILADYGITEAEVGAAIVSSMETVPAGHTANGVPLYFDRHAYEADAIVLVARVKAHTDFKGTVESGLLKMAAIGLGKHQGAIALHSQGFDSFASLIPGAGRILIEKTPIALGVAIIENAYDEVARIEVLPAEDIASREPALLAEAKNLMPRLQLAEIDVLIVDEIGKNISGAGMDPNITGRFAGPVDYPPKAPNVQKIIVRQLTPQSHGNATGIGLADITTKRLVEQIDFHKTYTNCITSTVLTGAKIPLTAPNDREALEIAIRTCNRIDPERVNIVWIQNTLSLQHIYISETYGELLDATEGLRIIGPPQPFSFDGQGWLTRPDLFGGAGSHAESAGKSGQE